MASGPLHEGNETSGSLSQLHNLASLPTHFSLSLPLSCRSLCLQVCCGQQISLCLSSELKWQHSGWLLALANWPSSSFVSGPAYTSSPQHDRQTRRLYVSDNHARLTGDVSFTEVQLPSLKPEQFYVVMATHESGAFIHVTLNISQSSGALYVSDSSGSRYSLSLANHMVSPSPSLLPVSLPAPCLSPCSLSPSLLPAHVAKSSLS